MALCLPCCHGSILLHRPLLCRCSDALMSYLSSAGSDGTDGFAAEPWGVQAWLSCPSWSSCFNQRACTLGLAPGRGSVPRPPGYPQPWGLLGNSSRLLFPALLPCPPLYVSWASCLGCLFTLLPWVKGRVGVVVAPDFHR